MALALPPTREPLTEDDRRTLSMQWLLFFNQISNGDAGKAWVPTFIGLTEVGGAAIKTGRYYSISRYLTYFNILITPGTNTSATAGTTYVDNFPLTAKDNGVCFSISNNLGGGLGMVNASNNRIYVPTWTTATTPINIIGIVEAT